MEKNLAAELRVRDAEVTDRQRTIDKLRAKRLSLQELAQFRQKLNQMITTPHSTKQTPTTNVIYMNNRNTRKNYNTGVRKTLQLKRITSLKIALARALEIKVIKEQNRK